LAEIFPIQVVTAWIGNSPKVAQKHYLRVLPSHYEQATKSVTLFDKKVVGREAFEAEKHDTKSIKEGGTKSVTVHAGNGLQINEAANKSAMNCSVLQPKSIGCNVLNRSGRTRRRFHNSLC
jgi:hypothetical protein